MVDDKLHFVREGVKPKHTSKTKKRIEKMRLTNDQIEAAINNSSMLMDGEFNFSPQKILNKKLIFDISMVDKETIMDKIKEGVDDPYPENDKYWTEHKPGSNYFTLRLKDAPGKFYKQSVGNISYFNKDKMFIIRIQTIDVIKYYWLEDAKNNKKLAKRFQRTELFAVRGNFFM